MNRPVKIGDRVRLRDGAHLWIAQRDGWTVGSTDDKTSSAIVKRDDAAICIHQDDLEPDSPPIPPEPPRVVGQAWRDADGTTVMTVREDDFPYTCSDDPFGASLWFDLAHPLTPLYPVPNPDGYVDREDVEPESPAIPLVEPKHVVGQVWRDAEGRTVVNLDPNSFLPYAVACGNDDYRWGEWQDLAHPLTPLYPVPDPDDDQGVVDFSVKAGVLDFGATRQVLRALRGDA